jgi:hypothetical protein
MLLLFPDLSELSDVDSAIYALRYSLFGDTVPDFVPDYTVELIPVGFAGFFVFYLLYGYGQRIQLIPLRFFYFIAAFSVMPASCWFAAPAVLYFWGNVSIILFVVLLKLFHEFQKKRMLKQAKDIARAIEKAAAAAAAAEAEVTNS